MEIIGRLVKLLPEVSGESQRGPWVKGGFVIETEEQYPKMVAFTLFGEDRLNMIRNIPVQSQVRVGFSVESREFQERWYTDLRCFKVEPFASATGYAQNPSPYYQQPQAQPYGNPYNPAPAPAVNQTYQQPQANTTPYVQPVAGEQGFNSIPPSGTDEDLPF